MPTSQPSDDNTQLDAIIAEYLEAVERGHKPDRDEFVRDHPDLATQLRAFFADLDNLNVAKAAARPELDATFISVQDAKSGVILGGRYKLLENIGEGGMGSVWVAEQQQPVKRKVAVKLVKVGMDSKQVLARFEAERQALAMMDHPNIAKVFDGGMTNTGRPYFVMEYVKGVPFTAYCDMARLSLKERLNLFIPVCQAVQHAHHKGIVHRDLKPSNILICLYDGKPVPKVIDFGLAKALHQQLTEQSLFTGHGVMIGTPLYMSPEQAEHNNLDVDTRTDIYSLGVVLYELLTGTTPLEREQLRTAAYNEILRLIKEVEPPRPSTRLSGNASLPSIAAQRNIDPKHLQRSLAGDLDWIVMKALEKERTRRYETATGLARDVERFLNEEAVEACPPTRSYRLRRFLRRNRRHVMTAAIVLLTVTIGFVSTTISMFRARHAERIAGVAEQKAVESLQRVTEERDLKNEALLAEAAQRKQAEQHFSDGVLRSIGFGERSADAAELRSYVDWSSVTDSHLKIKVLEIALQDSNTAHRLTKRADRVVQACVGLSPERWVKATELVSSRQRDMTADPGVRVAACWLALELGSADLPAFEESVKYYSKSQDVGDSTPFSDFTKLAVSRIDPQQQAVIRQKLLAMLEASRGYENSKQASACYRIASLADDLGDAQAIRASNVFLSTLETTDNMHLRIAAGDGLASTVSRLDQSQVDRCWNSLFALKTRYAKNGPFHMSAGSWKGVAKAMTALVAKLDQSRIDESWRKLVWGKNADDRLVLLFSTDDGDQLLAALAARLEPGNITQAFEDIVSDPHVNGETLAVIAPHLSETDALRGFELVSSKFRPFHQFAASDTKFTRCISTFVNRLGPEEVTRAWSEASARTITFLDDRDLGGRDNERRVSSEYMSYTLKALAFKIDAASIVKHWEEYSTIFEKIRSDGGVSTVLREASTAILETLAQRLAPADIAEFTDITFEQMPPSCQGIIAPKLSDERLLWCWDCAVGMLHGQGTANENAAISLLPLLAKHLPVSRRESAAKQLLTLPTGTRYPGTTEAIGVVIELLEHEARDRLSVEAGVRVLDCSASIGYRTSSSATASAFIEPKSIARLLSHPGCTGKNEEYLADRLEELLFHEGRAVYLHTDSHSVLSAVQNPPKVPSRQFHNLHDAALWIEQNWPDFDLDATTSVTWRGEP